MNLGKNYKVFFGDARNSIPAMKKEKHSPLSVAGIMQNRLKYGKDFSDWKDNYFDTIDACAYNTKGDAKIILDSNHIKKINSETGLREGAIVLGDGEFENLTGKKVLYLPKDKIKTIHNKNYTKENVKDSEVWNFLAGNNKLLSDYADEFFPEMKKRFGIDKAMYLYFDSPSNFDKLRAWYVDGLGSRSVAGAGDSLGYWGSQFVGFSGRAAGKKLEKEVLETISVAELLEKTNITSCYAPDQIKRLQNILEQNGYVIIKK